MYQDNVFPSVCEASPVQGAESPHIQLYRAWDGSYFAVPTHSNTTNKVQLDLHSTVTSSASDTKTMPITNKKKRKPLQNITNLSPPVPNNQFAPPPPQVQGLYGPSLAQGMTFGAGMPQFYHPGPTLLAQTPYPAMGLLPPHTSLHSLPAAETHTSTSHMAPVTVNRFQQPSPNRLQELSPVQEPSPNRFHESSPGFEEQQPFDILLSNLQEVLSSEYHIKNTSKAMESVPIQPSLVHAYIPTPSEDVWQKYAVSMLPDTIFNKSIHPSTFPTSDASYSTNQVVPSVTVTPYPIGFSVPATQYPNHRIKPNMELSPYPTDHSVSEPRLLTNQIVPNMSATDLSLKTIKQTVSNIVPQEPLSNSSQQILPNSSPCNTDASQSTDQERVAAREHSLKVRFSQLARHQATSSQVKELSGFLRTQSAQVEMHRLQQLTEASYPHYKQQVNSRCDSQLHQLMDRVEVSLQVLETRGKENHEVSRRRIPDKVSRVLEEWYGTNTHHPYPTAEIYVELASTTGMTAQQVRKWFSNKRCRSKVLHRSGGKVCMKQ